MPSPAHGGHDTGGEGTMYNYQYHNNGQCIEGTGISNRALPPGAVYISLVFIHVNNIYFVGKGSFLRLKYVSSMCRPQRSVRKNLSLANTLRLNPFVRAGETS